ncbi:MAG: hypothetical protein JJU11_12555 [Candidatus Sumerlaeia bacterium]|nr:hypothetical protein [Candidatus Sumerlaeia bacterium]
MADKETLYEMDVTLRAEAPSVLEISEEDLESAGQDAWNEIVDMLEGMSPEQVEEAVDQVHETHRFLLCHECRGVIHKILRRHRIPFEP